MSEDNSQNQDPIDQVPIIIPGKPIKPNFPDIELVQEGLDDSFTKKDTK